MSRTLNEEVELPSGRIHGCARDADGVLAFRGIPYAAPPVGPLRWRPPQPLAPWTGVRDARRFGAACPGARIPGYADRADGVSEDCLTLNVWTAATSPDERRPVMVWIHGGGFAFGSGAAAVNDGAALARAGMVVVTCNYRLGIFGFLAHPELDVADEPSGNAGLQDLIAVLRWTRETIALFGGDPDRVTIFGESAGAHAVGLLMVSPPARGLFQRAIAQSGAWWDSEHGSIPTPREARARGVAWIRDHGGGSIAAARLLPAAVVQRRAAWNFLLDPATTAFAPSIDGTVIPDTPGSLFEQGRQADVPLMAGWNDVEESVFTARGLPTGAAALRKAAERLFGAEAVAAQAPLFPSGRNLARRASNRLTGDLVIAEQVHAMLGTHACTAASGAWGYQFGHRSRFSPVAGHTNEIPFVFGTLAAARTGNSPPPGPEDEGLSAEMLSRWTTFAAFGAPETGGIPWPRYAGPGSRVLHFGPGPVAATPERNTDHMHLIAGARRNGRLPEAWRRERGRLPPLLAGLVRPALIAAVGIATRLRPPRGEPADAAADHGSSGATT